MKATEVKMNEVEFNPEFVSRMIPKLEWRVLVQAAEEVSVSSMTLPSMSRYYCSPLGFKFFVRDTYNFFYLSLCLLNIQLKLEL